MVLVPEESAFTEDGAFSDASAPANAMVLPAIHTASAIQRVNTKNLTFFIVSFILSAILL